MRYLTVLCFWIVVCISAALFPLSGTGCGASMLQTRTGDWSGGQLSGTVTDSTSGGVKLASGSSTGTVTSIPVATSGNSFIAAECVTYEPENTAMSVVLEGESGGVWTSVANVDTPGVFQEAINKRLSLTGLNLSGYSRVRLNATLTRSRMDRNPVLIEWRIRYTYAGEPQPTVYNFENVTGFAPGEQITTGISHSSSHSVRVSGGSLKSNRFPVQPGQHVGADMWLYCPYGQVPSELYIAVKGYASATATDMKAGVAYILSGGKNSAYSYWASSEPQPQGYVNARILQSPIVAGTWYHFTGRSVKTDTNDWSGWGPYYAPEVWDSLGITHVEIEVVANGGTVYLDDVSVVNDVPVPGRSQTDMEYNSVNMRPVWQQKYASLDDRLAALRAAAAADPKYATQVIEISDTITLKRDVWELTFSRSKASAISAVIRNRPVQGFSLPDLILTDSGGQTYRQRYAVGGSLSVSQTSGDIVLSGAFTPRTSGGTNAPVTFGVTYTVSRITGGIECNMDVISGSVSAKYLSISHSLGVCKPTIRYGFVENMFTTGLSGYPSPSYPYQDTSWEVTDSTTPRVVMAGPFPTASWSSQLYGVQVWPMSWKGAVITSTYTGPTKDSYLANLIDSDGSRDSRVTLIHTDTATSLSIGYRIASTFMLMPFKKYTPWKQSVVLAAMNSNYQSSIWANPYDPNVQAAFDEDMRQMAASGVTGIILQYCPYGLDFYGYPDKTTRDLTIATLHKYGMKAIMYLESSFIMDPHFLMMFGQDSIDEINTMWEKWYQHSGRPVDQYQMFKYGVWPCYNHKPTRQQMMVMFDDMLANSDIDGFYFDSDVTGFCANPDHEPGGVTNSMLPGRRAIHEDLRLLLDDYGRRNNKEYLFVCHSLFNVPGPVVCTSDFQLPGEPIMGRVVKSLQTLASDRLETEGPGMSCQVIQTSSPGSTDAPAIYYTTYNSMMGNQVILYDDRSYDLTLPQIYHEAYSRCLSPWLNAWPDVTWNSSWCRRYTDAEMAMYRKYMLPFSIFNMHDAVLHHWEDIDIHNYVVTEPAVQASVYVRPGECLVTVADDTGANRGPVNVTLRPRNLDLGAGEMLVYDIPNDALLSHSVGCGKASGPVNLSSGPAMLLVRPLPATPVVLWHDQVVKQVSESYSSSTRKLTVSLNGIHKAPAVVKIYSPQTGTPQVTVGTYAGVDATGHLHTVNVTFSTSGTASLGVTWP